MKKIISMFLLLCGFLTLSAVLVEVSAAEIISYKLVTDVADLTIGSTIIVTDTNSKFALGTTQNSNNRVAVAITASPDGSIPVTDGVQDIILGEGTQADTLAFNVGNGYLYAASSSANQLKTATAKSTNSDWKITIDSTTNDAEVKAQGNYTRNLLRKNSSSALFACYGSGQTAIKIYKKYVETAGADEVATVKFFINNGTETTVKEDTVAKGTPVLFPDDPSRPGYIFIGWFDAVENGNKVESLSPTENTNLYAHWEVDIYHHLVINSTELKKLPNAGDSGYAPYNGSHTTSTGEEFSSNQVMVSGNALQFQKDAGYLFNASAISGTIASISLDIETGSFAVSTSDSVLSSNGENVETLTTSNNKLVVSASNHSYFYIKNLTSGSGKINSIDIAYNYVERTTYSITFNAGAGVSFKEGKGTTIVANKGESTTVVLPTAEDLVQTPYKYSVLSSWNGRINRKPGESVTLDDDITFTALYVAPENLTVAQALEVAGITGTTATTISFTTTATISSINGKNVLVSDDSTSDTLTVYNPSNLSFLNIGDEVTITGKIKTYGTTKEYDVPKVVVVKSVFESCQTMASLKLVDTIDIRFGNMISANAYNTNAIYGVVASLNATDLENLTAEKIDALKAAGQGVTCVPVRVNASGVEDANGEYYQFAIVFTDVPATDYDVEIFATMYMILDGNVYTAQVKSASVKSVATAYLGGDTSKFSAHTLEILNSLVA